MVALNHPSWNEEVHQAFRDILAETSEMNRQYHIRAHKKHKTAVKYVADGLVSYLQ